MAKVMIEKARKGYYVKGFFANGELIQAWSHNWRGARKIQKFWKKAF